ncbi:dipeptidase PepE [Polaribacter sp. R2A056_3_33]|jgi:dipeptidase E|uniref:dipeptidase PepE n=1 Tax=unclassified Polaribacter TaxID=196858 RepID=UPI001C4E9E6C|nr:MULTISPECIES: dipeptidase PepE [unclassified Polaribacter]QXP64840.1 dipeptidase PepE [Polaribacter sp. HaHaR_3_91]QXP69489.1 dipeptidase PepE [Polaribacter sp. R2A056_3_33]
MKKMIIASTSTVHGSSYLEYLLPTLKTHFKEVKQLLFIPYARPSGISYDEYTTIAKNAFSNINIDVKGIHEFDNAKEAIQNSEAVFTGGGNTFELVNQLYKNDVLSTLKQVLDNGTPYLGTSAGSNICGINMKNTNDMPIVYPPSFTTLGCIPFNINAHYLDPIEGSTHMGETRETRIKEFHVFNETAVLGLREGSWLEVINDDIFLRGKLTARLFEQNKQPIELKSGGLIKF